MDFDEIVVKDSPGLCRCCLSEGCYKDLSTEYTWMGENEIYADMLFECFDISITQHTEGPNGSSRLICEVCITRLRDACNFKKQVLESEKKFVDMVGRGDFKPKAVIILEATPLKTEFPDPLPGPSEDDCEIEYLDEDDYTDGYRDDEPLQKLQAAGITVSSLSVKGKRGKKRSADTTKPVKAEKKKKTEGKSSKSKSSKGARKQDLLNLYRDVLFRISGTPFKWFVRGFACIFCKSHYKDWNEFLVHMTAEHEDRKEGHYFKLRHNKPLFLCVEINNAECRLCNKSIDNFDSLIQHLIDKHGCVFELNYRNHFIPFIIENDEFRCAYCEEIFDEFHRLYRHTVKNHFKGVLLCQNCGEGFSSRVMLERHVRVHRNQVYKCNECDETFKFHHCLRDHHFKEHKEKNVKCTMCDELFINTTFRRIHERAVHKKDLFKCDRCDRGFARKIELTRHKNTHVGKSPFQCNVCYNDFLYESTLKVHTEMHANETHKCEVCDKVFGMKRYLKRHLQVHSDERPHECEVCGKSFRTKRYLQIHFRIHSDERPFVCRICGEAFAHNTSLKLHVKKHENTTKQIVCEIKKEVDDDSVGFSSK